MNDSCYLGGELDLFAKAVNWKKYLRARVAGYLGSNVLEVGAGFGGSTEVFARGERQRWLCVEPDVSLAARLQASIEQGRLPAYCRVHVGTIADVAQTERFDSILYLDVLEHIDDDSAEVERAAALLAAGGHLIVVCPAHQRLFTPFDKKIGHYRRYNKRMFRNLRTPKLELFRMEYLDSIGLLASLGNRLLLRQSLPTARQIAVWDKIMVPLSRCADFLARYSLGKSVLGVWRRRP